MGELLDGMEKGLSTFLQELQKKRTTQADYRARAQAADYQAALIAAQAQAQNTYLLQSSAQKARNIYQTYLQTQSARQTALAAAGLRADSATVQYMLKNNRFQALLDEKAVAAQLQSDVSANNAQAAEQIRALKSSAQAYLKSAYKNTSRWSLGTAVSNFLGGF